MACSRDVAFRSSAYTMLSRKVLSVLIPADSQSCRQYQATVLTFSESRRGLLLESECLLELPC